MLHRKKRRARKENYLGMAATTTAWDWGFKPVPGKGGKTTNCGNSDSWHDD